MRLLVGRFFIMPQHKITTKEFIDRSTEIHKGKFDYSLVEYSRAITKVKIICPNHGIFEQTPNAHLSGFGCSKCRDEYLSEKFISNKESFIKKCIKVHGFKYDYSLVDYKGAHVKVDIICKRHGVFSQKAANHSNNKRGCPICGIQSRTNSIRKNPTGWSITNWGLTAKKSKEFDSFKVYILKCWNENEVFYKVGRTFKVVEKRFSRKRDMPYSYNVIKVFNFKSAKEAFSAEASVKSENVKNKYLPSIDFRGKYECFSNIDEMFLLLNNI